MIRLSERISEGRNRTGINIRAAGPRSACLATSMFILLGSACGTLVGETGAVTGIGYDCGEFGDATFYPAEGESAELVIGVNRYPLRQERSASGARYKGPDIEFWSRGTEAMLVLGLKNATCRQQVAG